MRCDAVADYRGYTGVGNYCGANLRSFLLLELSSLLGLDRADIAKTVNAGIRHEIIAGISFHDEPILRD